MTISNTIFAPRTETSVIQRTSRVRQLTEQLATGLKVNRASDNPAALIAATSLDNALVRLMAQNETYSRVSNQAATADAGLSQASGLLIEANRLAVANGSVSGLSSDERAANQMQLDSVLSSLDRVGRTTQFNGTPLLDGSATLSANGQSVTLPQISTNNLGQTEVDGLSYTLSDVASGGEISTQADPEAAQKSISAALSAVVSAQGQLGGFQQYAIQAGMQVNYAAQEQTSAATSNIRDLNYATASAELTRAQLLSQAGFKMMMESMGFTRHTASMLYGYLTSMAM